MRPCGTRQSRLREGSQRRRKRKRSVSPASDHDKGRAQRAATHPNIAQFLVQTKQEGGRAAAGRPCVDRRVEPAGSAFYTAMFPPGHTRFSWLAGEDSLLPPGHTNFSWFGDINATPPKAAAPPELVDRLKALEAAAQPGRVQQFSAAVPSEWNECDVSSASAPGTRVLGSLSALGTVGCVRCCFLLFCRAATFTARVLIYLILIYIIN